MKESMENKKDILENLEKEVLSNPENSELTAEQLQSKIDQEMKKIEDYSEQIIDIPEYQEKQIASLGGNEQELVDEMNQIDTEIKRTKSGFIERTKNYVIGLAAMVASVGSVAASTKQEVKTPNNIKYEKPTVQDSLDLYNNSKKILKYYNSKKYVTSFKSLGEDDGTPISHTINNFSFSKTNEALKRFRQLNAGDSITYVTKDLVHKGKGDKNVVENFISLLKRKPAPLPENVYYKEVDKNKFYQRELATHILDTKSPMTLYDKRIIPTFQYNLQNIDTKDPLELDVVNIPMYDTLLIKPVSMLTQAEKIERYKKYGDKSGIPNPNKKTPETTKKTTTVAPKTEAVKTETKTTVELKKNANDVTKDSIRTKIKTNKVEIKKDKIVYVDNKNDPGLKAYNDSLGSFKYSEDQIKKAKKDGFVVDKGYYKNPNDERKFNGIKNEKWKSLELKVPIPAVLSGIEIPVYKKPTVEVKYRPKPKLTEVGLKPIEAVKIPTEQAEVNPLANLKQKEIIKNPEKTGYTVRVGEKLYYLSKEDVNKLEADKTTFYNSSEKGDGTEKHLVWNGYEQGLNLQQVAERLGVKLPIAFDTNRQDFDK